MLRRMCSHFLRASCNFLYGPLGASRSKLQRLRGDCVEIVQSQWSWRAVSAASRRLIRTLTHCYFHWEAIAWRWCNLIIGATVPFYDACGLRAVPVIKIVRCHLRTMFTGYGLYDSLHINVLTSRWIQNRRGHGVPWIRTKISHAASCLRTGASR